MLSQLVLLFNLALATSDSVPPAFFKKDLKEIHATLVAASQSTSEWVQSLNQKSFDLLCLGESHEDLFRQLYGLVLKDLHFQKLAIESTREDLELIHKSWVESKQAKLLGADFAPILIGIEGHIQSIPIVPVESTKEQDLLETQELIHTGKTSLSRDGFIAQNLLNAMSSGEKLVALYGRHHCSKNNMGLGSVPFFNFLQRVKTGLNVMVLKRRGTTTIHPLVVYLDMGVEGAKPVRVIESAKIKDEDHNFNWEIKTLTDNFDYIIVY